MMRDYKVYAVPRVPGQGIHRVGVLLTNYIHRYDNILSVL